MQVDSQAIKVAVRVRPFLSRENHNRSTLSIQGQSITAESPSCKDETNVFAFDYAFWSANPRDRHFISQQNVAHELGSQLCENAYQGFNGCLIAYGQTGAGKSYTVLGYGEEPGLIPNVTAMVFKGSPDPKIWISYLEIYQETIRDLLDVSGQPANLTVCEHPLLGAYIPDLTESPVERLEDVRGLVDYGSKMRVAGSTLMNCGSSRSHSIFSIRVEATNPDGLQISPKISLIDLAGSEGASRAGATCSINRSLSHLVRIIGELAEHCSHARPSLGSVKTTENIPFRSSKLTFLMKDALSDNSKTLMVAAVSPAEQSYNETLATLRFAQSVKKIKTNASVNVNHNEFLVKDLQKDCDMLRSQLGTPHSQEAMVTEVRDEVKERERLVEWLQKSYQVQFEAESERKEMRDAILCDKGLTALEIKVMLSTEKNTPFLHNVCEDPLLSGCLIYFLKEQTTIGSDPSNVIVVKGLDIKDRHGIIANSENSKISFIPCEGARTLVNGEIIDAVTVIRDHDRIVLGRGMAMRLLIPSATNSRVEASPLELDDILLELHPNASPAFLDFKNYIDEMRVRVDKAKMDACVKTLHRICPLVDTANQMAKELHPEANLTYELECIWDIYSWEEEDFLLVRVKKRTEVAYFWTIKKFMARYEQMEEVYQTKQIDPLNDPFIELEAHDIMRIFKEKEHEHWSAMKAVQAQQGKRGILSMLSGMYGSMGALGKEVVVQRVSRASDQQSVNSLRTAKTSGIASKKSTPFSDSSKKSPVRAQKVAFPLRKCSDAIQGFPTMMSGDIQSLEELTRLTLDIKRKVDAASSKDEANQETHEENIKLKNTIEELNQQLLEQNQALASLMPTVVNMATSQNGQPDYQHQASHISQNISRDFTNQSPALQHSSHSVYNSDLSQPSFTPFNRSKHSLFSSELSKPPFGFKQLLALQHSTSDTSFVFPASRALANRSLSSLGSGSQMQQFMPRSTNMIMPQMSTPSFSRSNPPLLRTLDRRSHNEPRIAPVKINAANAFPLLGAHRMSGALGASQAVGGTTLQRSANLLPESSAAGVKLSAVMTP
eukprot:GEMP01004739.1.p1 GENE.GEMP01004739.1~~GEMP01004739.1.p1  ORF type:complete len:1062 (+),score=203.83 GEMP01004739.1:113-3298(+)